MVVVGVLVGVGVGLVLREWKVVLDGLVSGLREQE